MGLDLRLSYKKEETVYEANGRSAFSYVREWVESKGGEFDYYGEYLQLTKEDVEYLIDKAIQYYMCDYKSLSEMMKDCISDTHECYYIGFLQKLLLIKATENYGDYYLECDW